MNKKRGIIFLSILLILILITACTIKEKELKKETTENKNQELKKINEEIKPETSKIKNPLEGSWRIFSERIYYDKGGAGALGTPVSRNLEITASNSWNFGDSKGTITIAQITEEDWKKWGIEKYGPTRKVIVNNWNKLVAEGPLEESTDRIDFIWIIYHVDPPLVQNPGTVWMKFGHGN